MLKKLSLKIFLKKISRAARFFLFSLRELDFHELAAFAAHSHAYETVNGAEERFVVRDEDELRFFRELAQQVCELLAVLLV